MLIGRSETVKQYCMQKPVGQFVPGPFRFMDTLPTVMAPFVWVGLGQTGRKICVVYCLTVAKLRRAKVSL